MIRPMETADLDAVMEIWLEANLEAHHFIPARYWRERLDGVREQLPRAEVHVWEENGAVQGFLGLQGEYLAGIFVRREARSRGIGRRLLTRAVTLIRKARPELAELTVFAAPRAVEAYRHLGFTVDGPETVESGVRFTPMRLKLR